MRYEIQLKNEIDSELNNNDEDTVGTIERPNQDKQGKNPSGDLYLFQILFGLFLSTP